MSLKSDWKNWCRTCGNLMSFHGSSLKICSLDNDLLEIIHIFFETPTIQILQTDSVICDDCHRFVKELVKFSQHCNKIQKMFLEIHLDFENVGECDVFNVRSRYNLEEIDEISSITDIKQHLSNQQNNKTQMKNPIEIVKIEIKVEDINHDEDDNGELALIDEINSKKRMLQLYNGPKTESHKENIIKYKSKSKNKHIMHTNTDHLKTDNACILNDKILTNAIDGISATMKADSLSKLKEGTFKSFPKSIKCSICKLEYKKRTEFEMHMKKKHLKHENVFSCTECQKCFPTLAGLRSHERIHASGSKLHKDAFVCDKCGKSCASITALGEHQSIHSNDYSYECKNCPKKFKHLYRLRRHENTNHTGLVFQCDNCGLQFNTKDKISSHMIVHSEHKKYRCNYCGKEYKRPRALKNHLILHSGLKPYKCPFCDKSFTYGTSCRSHKKRVHPQELADLEASGEILPATNLPNIAYLQPAFFNQ